MIKLIQLLNELGINNPTGIKATLRDNPDNPYFDSKVYRVKIDDKTEFTIHKYKNYYTLYPWYSFSPKSPKYIKIKTYLINKNVKFEEFQNSVDIINLRIPLNQVRI